MFELLTHGLFRIWTHPVKLYTIVFTPLSAGGCVEPPTKFSKRAGLKGPKLLEEGWWEIYNFYKKKNKLKFEIFKDKKVNSQKSFFICHN